MSTIYTYSEARQNLASLLEKAVEDGEVKIRRKDGQVFVIRPVVKTETPLDVEGIDLGLNTDEIVAFIRESRSRGDESGQ